MQGARAWAVGDSGLWVPAPTHSGVPAPATPHPPAKGKSRDRNCICMWSSGPRGHGARATWTGAGGWKTPEG